MRGHLSASHWWKCFPQSFCDAENVFYETPIGLKAAGFVKERWIQLSIQLKCGDDQDNECIWEEDTIPNATHLSKKCCRSPQELSGFSKRTSQMGEKAERQGKIED